MFFLGLICDAYSCFALPALLCNSETGDIKPYNGNKYKTVDDRYADGWALNSSTHRWIKVAKQQQKAAVEAHPALMVGGSG